MDFGLPMRWHSTAEWTRSSGECAGCPANALAELAPETLAGCYGLVPLPDHPRPIYDAIERGIEAAYPGADWSGLCRVTKPRWYGLWLDSPLSAERLVVRFLVLNHAANCGPALPGSRE